MFCPKCGESISEGQKFCSKCGNSVQQPNISKKQDSANDYQLGYEQGYSDGSAQGYNQGYAHGCNSLPTNLGYSLNFKSGYNKEYNKGYNKGYDEGYKKAYNKGYNKGYNGGNPNPNPSLLLPSGQINQNQNYSQPVNSSYNPNYSQNYNLNVPQPVNSSYNPNYRQNYNPNVPQNVKDLTALGICMLIYAILVSLVLLFLTLIGVSPFDLAYKILGHGNGKIAAKIAGAIVSVLLGLPSLIVDGYEENQKNSKKTYVIEGDGLLKAANVISVINVLWALLISFI